MIDFLTMLKNKQRSKNDQVIRMVSFFKLSETYSSVELHEIHVRPYFIGLNWRLLTGKALLMLC